MRVRIPAGIRWAIVRRLDKRPDTCWGQLVGWALNGETFLPDESCWQTQCRRDADESGRCYCGKFRNEAKLRELEDAIPRGEGAF